MFELGKKYKYGSHIYTCMYVGKKYSVLESETRSEACPHTYMANGHHGWSEYKEPVIKKETFYLRINNTKELYFMRDARASDLAAQALGIKTIGVVELTIIDDVLTSVSMIR